MMVVLIWMIFPNLCITIDVYKRQAIGNVYVNYRLFLLHGEAKYYDVLERTLYNGLISVSYTHLDVYKRQEFCFPSS